MRPCCGHTDDEAGGGDESIIGDHHIAADAEVYLPCSITRD